MNGRGQGVIVLPEGFPYCRLLNSHFLQMVLVFPLLKHPKKRIQLNMSIWKMNVTNCLTFLAETQSGNKCIWQWGRLHGIPELTKEVMKLIEMHCRQYPTGELIIVTPCTTAALEIILQTDGDWNNASKQTGQTFFFFFCLTIRTSKRKPGRAKVPENKWAPIWISFDFQETIYLNVVSWHWHATSSIANIKTINVSKSAFYWGQVKMYRVPHFSAWSTNSKNKNSVNVKITRKMLISNIMATQRCPFILSQILNFLTDF